MKQIKKIFEFWTTKIIQKLNEKNFEFNDELVLKYLLERDKESSNLIVVFSACTRKGIKARYNYVRTLNAIKANKLFILDDFAKDKRGAYYLGKHCDNQIEKACKMLIKKTIEKYNIQKVIMCGSSKGGWAALNLMTEFNESYAIIGAPQYKLANYLLAPALEVCREYVMGNVTPKKIKYLNTYLYDKLQCASDKKHKIYLHYSENEHTYEEHIKYLIEDIKKLSYDVEYDCCKYHEHWDVSKYYPDYLLRVLNRVLEKREI